MKSHVLFFKITMLVSIMGCQEKNTTTSHEPAVKLITLDPGHFHAALVQKEMYPAIDTTVYVYAPGGAELDAHLALVSQYNSRADNPTHWAEKVYTGPDYLDKMLTEKKGNVVVLSGNNQQKTEYIVKSIDAGLNVLGDKPMAINTANFASLEQAFTKASANGLLLYDIMTERSEITNLLQQELVHMPDLFGTLQTGSVQEPAIIMESVHFFYKYVSGKVLRRPSWFFDPAQQGDAITDVGTHLIDLVQWQAFPNQALDYKKDITINSAKIWPTNVALSQFKLITGSDSFPSYLKSMVKTDSILEAHGNGEINYTLKNIHAKIIARWNYQALTGGDTHYSLFKGTKATIEIKQGKEENYLPTLYIKPNAAEDTAAFSPAIQNAVDVLNKTHAGITAEKTSYGWKLVIPQTFKVGHEAHFAQVMQRYLQYLNDKKLPDWEVPNMLAKYYTSTKALEMAAK